MDANRQILPDPAREALLRLSIQNPADEKEVLLLYYAALRQNQEQTADGFAKQQRDTKVPDYRRVLRKVLHSVFSDSPKKFSCAATENADKKATAELHHVFRPQEYNTIREHCTM